MTLPKDPPPSVKPGRSWSFQLTPAFWFGMAMCDTASYPEQVSTCAADSDANITPLAKHPGTAFMELQFYPPGWVKQFNSQSCDPRDWCAALTIDSLSEDPVAGTTLNQTCQNEIPGGIEYVNFAFLTRSPGFDGTSYLPLWPDGNTKLHPTAQLFSSPLTGRFFNHNYSTVAFESDTPRIEAPDLGGACDRTTGAGCTIIPPTDDGQPATFYPFFSITSRFHPGGCRWFIGNDVPGLTATDFGKVSQYGTLFPQTYLVFGGGGATHTVINDFQKNLGTNPCPAVR